MNLAKRAYETYCSNETRINFPKWEELTIDQQTRWSLVAAELLREFQKAVTKTITEQLTILEKEPKYGTN